MKVPSSWKTTGKMNISAGFSLIIDRIWNIVLDSKEHREESRWFTSRLGDFLSNWKGSIVSDWADLDCLIFSVHIRLRPVHKDNPTETHNALLDNTLTDSLVTRLSKRQHTLLRLKTRSTDDHLSWQRSCQQVWSLDSKLLRSCPLGSVWHTPLCKQTL